MRPAARAPVMAPSRRRAQQMAFHESARSWQSATVCVSWRTDKEVWSSLRSSSESRSPEVKRHVLTRRPSCTHPANAMPGLLLSGILAGFDYPRASLTSEFRVPPIHQHRLNRIVCPSPKNLPSLEPPGSDHRRRSVRPSHFTGNNRPCSINLMAPGSSKPRGSSLTTQRPNPSLVSTRPQRSSPDNSGRFRT